MDEIKDNNQNQVQSLNSFIPDEKRHLVALPPANVHFVHTKTGSISERILWTDTDRLETK